MAVIDGPLRDRYQRTSASTAFVALVIGLAALAGLGVTWSPVGVLLLAAAAAWALSLGDTARVERLLLFSLLGGALVLGYGFANVGLRSSIPVPLADVILLTLVAAAVIGRPDWRAPARIVLPVAIFVAIVLVRLGFDIRVWHSLAVRDSTTAVETLAVLVGYRALARDGIGAWVRRLEWIFIAVLVYGSLSPWRDSLASHGPTVGLQRAIPLFGVGAVGQDVSVVAAVVFFALYARGTRQIVLLAWGIGVLALVQSRGLYLALTLSVIVVGWCLHSQSATWLRVAGALALATVLLAIAAGAGVSGRLGQLSPDFYFKHVETIAGDSGPGAKSYHDRVVWARKTIDAMKQSTTTEAMGVGLGPDLAFGFAYIDGASVRKPHDDFLEVLARTGVVGFSVFMFMLWSLVAPVARRARGVNDDRARFCAFVLAATAAYLVVAATQPLLAYPYGTLPVFIWLGMGAAVVSGLGEDARLSTPARSDG